MNDRITLLALQASDPKTGWLDRQKFAELIVQECADVVYDRSGHATPQDLYEHFGVET
jgi:hypothetical protein